VFDRGASAVRAAWEVARFDAAERWLGSFRVVGACMIVLFAVVIALFVGGP
jgi:hypothetical protein